MQKEETINHLFMECNRARKIWFGSNLGITFSTNHRNFVDWLLYCFTTLKDEDLCYLASVTYEIWYARNLHVFEDRDIEDAKILEQAYTTIMDYQKATQNEASHMQRDNRYRVNPKPTNNHTRAQHASHKWKKPIHGEIKGNCDANLSIEGRWGIGAMFRDREGHTLASATWQLPGFNDPNTAEACALYLMTKLAVDCCFTSVEFESDCASIIKGVNEFQANHRTYSNNLLLSVNRMRARFRFCSFRHISRRANKVAHNIALLAHTVPNYVWLEETHESIVNLVHLDLF
jgi:hypothetical protein